MKDLIAKQLGRKRLWERRKTLEGSIPVVLAERRLESRLSVPERGLSPYSKSGVLLNLSEKGFAVEIPERCRFARGESHRLRLSVRSGSVEVDGTVCWTKSTWDKAQPSSRTRYSQIAGFEILDSVPDDTLSILGIVRGMVRDSRVAVEVSETNLLGRIGRNNSSAI